MAKLSLINLSTFCIELFSLFLLLGVLGVKNPFLLRLRPHKIVMWYSLFSYEAEEVAQRDWSGMQGWRGC